ncbi:Uncharacterised protein [Nocardia otitidiscaviarum]|uniref:Outer membrane channel protein CpnT-like N-terminal domain-containing protein n=1 Tax=Nocardia otitidiscaviarum TaxID=1823 RepID=A0A378Y8X7_9NOCA|nr:hypothetical protein [Nocardia otitidiscaviarum]SUA72809.1 Uncharacterised protein [Nocardia otitidiscaviarum]
MAIQIPSEVALFLNFLGFPYPDINEDHVRELADQVRTFAEKVRNTHTAATGTINDMGSVYSGYSYEQLVTTWARMSATNMADLDQACTVVATALDAAAVVIVTVKIAVLTELAALAVAYATAMSAAVATSGLSATMGPAIAAAARRLLVAMEQTLLSYLLAEVIGRAIEPLEETVARVVNGFAYESARRALGVPSEAGPTQTLHIDPDEVLRYAKVLDDHAADITRHAEDFANNVAGLDFTTSGGGMDEPAGIPRTSASPDPGPGTGAPDSTPHGDSRYAGDPSTAASPATVAAPTARPLTIGLEEPSGTTPSESAATASASESRAQHPTASAPDDTGRGEQSTDAARQAPGTPDQNGSGTAGQPAGANNGGNAGRPPDQSAGDTPAPVRAMPDSSEPVGQRPGAESRSDGQHDIRATDTAPATTTSDPAASRAVGSLSDTTAFTTPSASAAATAASVSASGDGQRDGSGAGNLAPSAGASPPRATRATPWTRKAKPAGSSTTPPEQDLVDPTRPTAPHTEHTPLATPWSRTRPAADTPAGVSVPETTRPAPKVATTADVSDTRRAEPIPPPGVAASARPVAADHGGPPAPNGEADTAGSAAPAGPAVPRTSTGPGEPGKPDKPAEPGESGEPAGPGGSGEPAAPGESAGPAGPEVSRGPRRPGGVTAPEVGPPTSV